MWVIVRVVIILIFCVVFCMLKLVLQMLQLSICMVISVVTFVASVAASKNAFFRCTAVVTRPCLWPCASIFKAQRGIWPWYMAVFSTTSNFQNVDFDLPLCFSHSRCIMDNILTCYAWINHLNDLQMLYLIKWLYGLLIH